MLAFVIQDMEQEVVKGCKMNTNCLRTVFDKQGSIKHLR